MQEEILGRVVEATKRLRTAAEHMGKEAEAMAAKGDESDLPQRMNYDAAWCWRTVGEVEVDVARRALQADAVRKLSERLAAAGVKAPAPRAPEIPMSAIALQPGEKLARERFRAVIEAGGESPVADEARIELIELYGQREEADAAIELIKSALTNQPNADLTDRLKVRMAFLQLAKGDLAGATATAGELVSNERGGYAPYGRAVAAEAAYRSKNDAAVIEQGRAFLESPRGVGRMPGVADHAILRMAEAQGRLGQWQAAQGTLDTFFARFGNGGSALTYEARVAQGWVNENLKEIDRAIEAYAQAASRSNGEQAARANLQVARLRLAQGKSAGALPALLAVANNIDDRELSPPALFEAGRSLTTAKPAEARRLLERVVKVYPSSPWAAVAKKELEGPAAPGQAAAATPEGPWPALVPSAVLAPRLPNLLVTSRKAQAAGNPAISPAPPITTPTVNNAEGTSAMSLLGPIVRGIHVDVMPSAAPAVSADEAYVQSPAARDDADAPAAGPVAPAAGIN
jgi:TolA-binding protein